MARDVAAVMGGSVPDGVPTHWAVDFRVPDADATAAKAKELGGKSIVSPFDVPRFRQAVLADPQSAVFSVSSLKGKV